MLTRKRTKQLQLQLINDESSTAALPPDVWKRVAMLLEPRDIYQLSLSSHLLHDITHSQEVQVSWLLATRPGQELLTATHAGMRLGTVKALMETMPLYSDYKAKRLKSWGHGCPSLLGNAAHKGDAAVAALLIDMGESVDEPNRVYDEPAFRAICCSRTCISWQVSGDRS